MFVFQHFRFHCFRVFGIAALLIACTTFVQARIGETILECEVRYGPGKDDIFAKQFGLVEGARQRIHEVNGWPIRIAFVDGVAVREEFMKPASAGGPLFNAEDVQAILKAEAGAGTWTFQESSGNLTLASIFGSAVDKQKAMKAASMGKVWVRSDGALAMLRPGGMIVRVESAQAAKIDEKIKLEKEKKQKQAIPKF